MHNLENKRGSFCIKRALLGKNDYFKPTNYTISVSGIVQKYNTTRRKIEIKREIRDRFPILKDNTVELAYVMEHHTELHELLERILQIRGETGELPTILSFRKYLNVSEEKE